MEAGAAMTLSGRDAYREELTRLAADDPRILCLEADLGGRQHAFADAHPDRFFNIGIAEGTMIDMAAALAIAGYKPFASTFAPFAALRAAESVKLSLGYLGAGVTLVAPYAGVSGAWFGTTHHCLEDIALLRTLPGVVIAAPHGEDEMRAVVRAAAASERPFYIRTGRNAQPESLPRTSPEIPVVNWDARPSELCLVSIGEIGTELCLLARQARPELGHAHLCYLDHEHLRQAAEQLAAACHSFIVVEEHRPAGGIAEALALLMPGRIVMGVNAGYAWPSTGGDHHDVLCQLGLDVPAVLAAATSAARVTRSVLT
jgi:transketolase